ncbi:MAG: class II glutamine amidotransferase [Methylophaga sp.]|nr:class II glutamine amidotransferase [Methylophaga sp.]
MCQLLGISSQQPVNPRWLLADFFQRGGATAEHKDGWGIASFDEQENVQITKSSTAASQCELAEKYLTSELRSKSFVAHIRKATYGEINLNNTHPFKRTFWGQDWVFSHNGDLHGYHPEPNSLFQVEGDTDSERAFCHLLCYIAEHYAYYHPRLDALVAQVKRVSDEISRFGSFNFILANNQLMIAYASTELYWTVRQKPLTRIALVDSDKPLDLESDFENNSTIIVATKPLTKGEVWYPMGRGEIILFSQGELKIRRFNPADTQQLQVSNTLYDSNSSPLAWGLI